MDSQIEEITGKISVQNSNKLFSNHILSLLPNTKKNDKLKEISVRLGLQSQDEEAEDEETEEDDYYYDLHKDLLDKRKEQVTKILDTIIFNQNMGKGDETFDNSKVINFLVHSMIDLSEETWPIHFSDDDTPKTPVTDDTNDIVCINTLKVKKSSLLDEYAYFTFENSVELTHQVPLMDAVLQYTLQDKSKFQFGTLEETRLTKIMKAFQKYDVEKERTFGDFNVRLNIELNGNSFSPHFLFAECQRLSCTNVFKHKDFIKICLIMRTALKHTLNSLFRVYNVYWLSFNISVFALLASLDHVFVLEMTCTNKSKEQHKFRPYYSLKVIGKFHIYNDRENIMQVLFEVFTIGQKNTLRFDGKTTTYISTTPDEIKQRAEEEVMYNYDFLFENTVETYPDEHQKVNQFFGKNFIGDKGELCFVEAGFLTMLANYGNVYYSDSSNSFSLVKKENYSESPSSVLILSKFTRFNIHFLIGHVYTIESQINLKRKNVSPNANTTNQKKVKLNRLSTNANEGNTNQGNTNQKQSSTKITDQTLKDLTHVIWARKYLIEYLKENDVVCEQESLVERVLAPNNGISLYLRATYKNQVVFVKVNCYSKYFQNEELMQFMKSQNSNYLNKILDFKVSQHSSTQVGKIFKISEQVVNYMKLNGKIYLTIVEPVDEWVTLLRKVDTTKLTQFKKSTTLLSLVVKLLVNYLHGLKELHAMGVIHGDLNIMNCQVKLSKSDSLVSTLENFIGVLIDFNSSRLECQPLISDRYYPLGTHKPPDYYDFFNFQTTPKISFTKAHDIFSLSIIITQLSTIILVMFDDLKSNYSKINTFLMETRKPSDSNWVISQWDRLETQNNINSITELLPVFKTLKELSCKMFNNPWSVIEEDYCLKQLGTLESMLFGLIEESPNKSGN